MLEKDRERGEIALYVSDERDVLLFGGVHSGHDWCWCQPSVSYRPCPAGHWHPVLSHKKFADKGMDSARATT